MESMDKKTFDNKIFEGYLSQKVFLSYSKVLVCHKPDAGTEMTFAYFHLKPYVFVDKATGNVTSGIEANMAMEFAKKYNLKMKWFDAKFVWGAFIKETQRFDSDFRGNFY